GIRVVRDPGCPPEEIPARCVRPSPARGRSPPVPRVPAPQRSRHFEGTGTDAGGPRRRHEAGAGHPDAERPRPGAHARGPAAVRGDRHHVSPQERRCGHPPEDHCGDPRGAGEGENRPSRRWARLTVWKASRPGRFTLVILAAIAIGIPVIVVAASGWPFVPILLGGWV